ncbi:hypothetical protein QBC46DRAFT_275664, partial [Diplogelasinospora grovesii]
KQIGLTIPAADVRLITSKGDLYSWKYLAEVKHLFSKNLSDHSVKACKQLCAGVGQTFEAILPTTIGFASGEHTEPTPFETLRTSVSFTSRIAELTEYTEELKRQIRDAGETLNAEASLRHALEEDLKNAKEKCTSLKKELQQSRDRADFFERIVFRYTEGMNETFPILNEMRDNIISMGDGQFLKEGCHLN